MYKRQALDWGRLHGAYEQGSVLEVENPFEFDKFIWLKDPAALSDSPLVLLCSVFVFVEL